ncbi:biopolymer transporter ExbD [Roseibium sp. MMSF_3412]|uniref:ExbD/TolR family protein n=1 Tax=Roseibium sp. MMSF_3412 TaxID=3046712 RepID=UPI00273F4EC7|nr:biopolymer transporter ExbD [Roseibium sp. MMSF_3412]
MKRYTKPIHLPKPLPGRSADSSLALINVVFLLLLFLLVSGTLRPPLPDAFEWAETTETEGEGQVRNTLVLTRTGDIWFEGEILDEAGFDGFLADLAGRTETLSVQVDRHAKMEDLGRLATRMRTAGVKGLSFVTIEAENP